MQLQNDRTFSPDAAVERIFEILWSNKMGMSGIVAFTE